MIWMPRHSCLVDLLLAFLAPDFGPGQQIHAYVVIPTTAIAEISMVIYLLVVGVKTVKPDNRIPAAARADGIPRD